MLEKDVSEIWKRQRFNGRLLTDSRESVKVLYPGRVNDNRGGDFCDAVIQFPDRTVRGEVELHVRSGDWRLHGHDRDPSYNGVVLHVVYAQNTDGPTMLENGSHVPILALDGYVERRDREGARLGGNCALPCLEVATRLSRDEVTSILDFAGGERFDRRVAAFAHDLETAEPGQVLYQGVMEALGYSRNRGPFRELSSRLPLRFLEELGGPVEEFQGRVEDELLLAAGLRGSGALPPLGWQLLRARPSNSPAVRIKAMSHLLKRYRRQGLLTGLIESVRKCSGPNSNREIEDALMVTVEESAAVGRLGCVLGRDRAKDISVNVLLPFARVFGKMRRDCHLEDKAILLYSGWPRHGTNCVERHMLHQTGLTSREVNSAQRQQGLMEVYSTMCIHGRCSDCALGQSESRHNIQVKCCPAAMQVAEVAR